MVSAETEKQAQQKLNSISSMKKIVFFSKVSSALKDTKITKLFRNKNITKHTKHYELGVIVLNVLRITFYTTKNVLKCN